MLTPYPDSIPIDAIDSIIGMIKDKNADKAALGLSIWNVQGYVQSLLLSVPSIKSYGSVPDQIINDDEAIEHLTQLKASGATGVLSNASSMVLSMLLKWLLTQALNYLNR